MALKGKKPSVEDKRLKALFFGVAGAGKTTAAIQFPRPYLIDTEKGATNDQYVELINKGEGAVLQTCDFDELVDEVKALLTEKHNYKTLIIDPLTTLYNDLLEKAEREVGSDFGRHYGHANKKMKHLLGLLLRLDMNVIITAHAKNEYGEGMAVMGQTFDCYKKLDYLFDLVFEIQKRGKQRVAVVKKTRIKAFEESEVFPFSYDEVATRYGRDILERDAVHQVLATQEQLIELKRLIDLLKVPRETIDKWLKKGESTHLEDMATDNIQKCIDYLMLQVKGEKK